MVLLTLRKALKNLVYVVTGREKRHENLRFSQFSQFLMKYFVAVSQPFLKLSCFPNTLWSLVTTTNFGSSNVSPQAHKSLFFVGVSWCLDILQPARKKRDEKSTKTRFWFTFARFHFAACFTHSLKAMPMQCVSRHNLLCGVCVCVFPVACKWSLMLTDEIIHVKWLVTF